MPRKNLMMDELGERALLLPQLLAEALAANDRIKFLLTLLQTAERRVHAPDAPAPDLSVERRAAGIEDSRFDQALAEAGRDPSGMLHLPGAAFLRRTVLDGIAAMRAPLELAEAEGHEELARREAALAAALPPFDGDLVPEHVVDAMTSGDRARGDSLHILVMDLHKAINALQAGLSEESIDGAHVWHIAEADRPLVAAFMHGLNETAPLKFGHPGLDTTVTRAGARLVIQNDIGTTDAHVLVIHVEGLGVTVTYTDIHAQRADFFMSLFKPFGTTWEDARTKRGRTLEEDNYYLCTGRFEAKDGEELARYLDYLGSRIVFLIDWNHTRKVLREFLPKSEGIRLLKWAAANNIGHRGFVALGGERLLYEAVEFAQHTPLRYGEKLHEAMGVEQAADYLKFVFRAAAEGLLHGRSERFIRDEVKTELARRLHGAQESLLVVAASHAAFVFELATALRESLLRFGEPGLDLDAVAKRAQGWEQEADALVSRTRSLVRRLRKPEIFREILHEADDAADALEEATFLATFLPKLGASPELLEPIHALSAELVEGAQELVKMFEAARAVRRDGPREDFDDFLETVDRLIAVEHETDATERAARGLLLMKAQDFRTLELLGSLARVLEEAGDALSRTALKLRDHLVNDVMAG